MSGRSVPEFDRSDKLCDMFGGNVLYGRSGVMYIMSGRSVPRRDRSIELL